MRRRTGTDPGRHRQRGVVGFARFAAVFLLAVGGRAAHAAGGHHSVDDAALLEAGRCEVEVWYERHGGNRRSLANAATGCRVGPVELGVGVDRARDAGVGKTNTVSPQLKWATPIGGRWSAGVVVAGAWQDRSPGYLGSSLIVPLTWQPADGWSVHVNAGRDFLPGARDTHRAGAAIEWTAAPNWTLVGERYREGGADYGRAGLRWAPSDSLSVDLSRAHSSGGDAPAWWTLGVNWVFGR